MKIVKFTVPGHPRGYYSIGPIKRMNWRKYNQYIEYGAYVRLCAVQAGIELPLQATRDQHIHIDTIAYFHSRVHCDPGNVQKGVCDALFWISKEQKAAGVRTTGDKYTGGGFTSPKYDKDDPRVEVVVAWLD